MKLLLILPAIVVLADAGGVMQEIMEMKKWAKMKAIESCFGSDVVNFCTVQRKKAVQKCSGVEAPELNLPMFKSPVRMIHALMMGAKKMEKKKLLKLVSLMTEKHEKSPAVATPTQTMTFVPYPMQTQSYQEGDNFLMKVMKRMLMKKMMKKLMGNHKDFDEDIEEGYDDEDDSSDLDFENFFKVMMGETKKQLRRYKRATDADLLDIGEKLVEKLNLEQEKMKLKWGNKTCVLQELGTIDSNRNLDLSKMLSVNEKYPIKDAWLKEKKTKAIRLCYAMVESYPREFLNECIDEKWFKIKRFFFCMGMHEMRICMAHDVKQKLENEFGTLEELEEDTGMDEKTLLMLTNQILSDDLNM